MSQLSVAICFFSAIDWSVLLISLQIQLKSSFLLWPYCLLIVFNWISSWLFSLIIMLPIQHTLLSISHTLIISSCCLVVDAHYCQNGKTCLANSDLIDSSSTLLVRPLIPKLDQHTNFSL